MAKEHTASSCPKACSLPLWHCEELVASTELVRRCPNLRGRCLSPGPHSGEGQARWPVGYASFNDGSAPLVVCCAGRTKDTNKPHPPEEDKDEASRRKKGNKNQASAQTNFRKRMRRPQKKRESRARRANWGHLKGIP